MQRHPSRGGGGREIGLELAAAGHQYLYLETARAAHRGSGTAVGGRLERHESSGEEHKEGLRRHTVLVSQAPTLLCTRPRAEPGGIDAMRREEEPVGRIAVAPVIGA